METTKRNDLHMTSAGVGHDYRPGYYFPDTEFRTTVHDPLPPTLAAENELRDPYKTTTGTTHDYKYHGGQLANDLHKRAAGHWKVNYMQDVREKLSNRGWRKPLTMGNQMSEMKDEYTGRRSLPGVDFNPKFATGPQPYEFQHHHNDGPTKTMLSSGENPALKAQPFFIRDKGILRELDPYISTTNKDHRSFKKDELKGYPKKTATTYWECEEYPKAWGHGSKHNPLPKDSVPRERPPMRDPTFFRNRTTVPRLPKVAKPVPNGGLATVYHSSYMLPSDPKTKHNWYNSVDTPWTIPVPGVEEIFDGTYNTTYDFYGSGKPLTVIS